MHRDLKPENIMLNEKYHLKVIDFGDAKYFEGMSEEEDLPDDPFAKGPGSDRRGTFVGTAYYVSPEMLNDNVSQPESDLWALGCIVY